MPQSSLLGWLSKRSNSSEQKSERVSDEHVKQNELPTPPPSSQEDISGNSTVTPLSQPQTGSVLTASNGLHQLNPNLELRACSKEDIPRLKQLNSLLLPIPYPEHFYRETIQDPIINNITLLAVWHKDPTDPKIARKEKETLVGAIRCRILNDVPAPANTSASETSKEGPMLYLSTLVLLSPYRGQAIASSMLEIVTKRAMKDHGVTRVGAHVWEANVEGLEWYRKRGFTEVRKEESYYPRLRPSGAAVMCKRLGVLDLVDASK